MLSEHSSYFTKENLDSYLKELAKEYRKLGGKSMPAEIILIGGAAVIANYGFRDMTTDVDALIHAASSMKEAINHVGDRFGLPNGWLNADFMHTGSYTPRLREYSIYYRTFSNVLTVRTISAEYLIAMKLRSGRQYKNDLSDIIGILAEHEKQEEPITWGQIDAAVQNLYGGWTEVPADARGFIENALSSGNYEQVYQTVNAEEKRSKEILLDFEQEYPGVARDGNIGEILTNLKSKQESRESVLQLLKEKKEKQAESSQ